MLLDDIVEYEPRRGTLPAAQVKVQEASARTQIPGPSTSRIPRTLKKPNVARVQYTHYHYHPSPSTPSSIALPRAVLAPTRTPSDASDSPVQSPPSSSSSRRLLKSPQGNAFPLLNLSFPSPSSPAPQVPAPTFSPISPPIPPQIPQIQTRPSCQPDQLVRDATQFGSPERPRTTTRPLHSPRTSSGTPTVESSSEPRKTGVNPSLVPRYSNVKNKRWALWSEWCY
jgi:hypothetical protein